jgi:hypothetical protein
MTNRLLKVAGAALACVILAGPASAKCKQEICTKVRNDGLTATVRLTTDWPDATHLNVIAPGQREIESTTAKFSFAVSLGEKYTYVVQACRQTDPSAQPSCTQWAKFRYKAKEPKNRVTQSET